MAIVLEPHRAIVATSQSQLASQGDTLPADDDLLEANDSVPTPMATTRSAHTTIIPNEGTLPSVERRGQTPCR